jgi:hypothetical protein
MNFIWQTLGLLVAAFFGAYLQDKMTAGLESVIKRALNDTVVRKLDEVIERLDASERRNGQNAITKRLSLARSAYASFSLVGHRRDFGFSAQKFSSQVQGTVGYALGS